MTTPYRSRLAKLKNILASRPGSAALAISSAVDRPRNADTNYSFRQNSNFYYLTGGTEIQGTLLLRSGSRRPLLITRKRTELERVWDGPGGNAPAVAREIGAELREVEHPLIELKTQISGVSELFYDTEGGTPTMQLAEQLVVTPGHRRAALPKTLSLADPLLEQLRLKKDRSELATMQYAAEVTQESVRAALPLVRPGTPEQVVAHAINAGFTLRGGTPAFGTIIGSGPSAATLHHHPTSRKIGREDLVLIDCGAEFEMYAADMTRTFPATGTFTKAQRELYQAVLDAHYAAVDAVRDGVDTTRVYEAAARELIRYLRVKKILKGTATSILRDKSFRPYFPHGIGHSLGLDVHDVGGLRAYTGSHLRAGMVFTIEPGLYFRKPVKGLPACGVRIEDAVVVTARGARSLTPEIPKEPNEIESWMATARE